MTSANDIAWSMVEFTRLWHSIIATLTIFSIMFGMCTVVKMHSMVKAKLDEMCTLTSGRDYENAKDEVSLV